MNVIALQSLQDALRQRLGVQAGPSAGCGAALKFDRRNKASLLGALLATLGTRSYYASGSPKEDEAGPGRASSGQTQEKR